MALPTHYAIGTVTVANGGTTVAGVGTGWAGKIFAGDLFTDPAQGVFARVTADATSDTSLSINAWPGTGLTADPYEILITPDTARVQERTRQVLELLDEAALPQGGTTGQVAAKASGSDFDVAWVDPVATAEDVSFAAVGSIVATTVQGALEELDGEKLAKTGGTMTGAVLVAVGAAGAPGLAFAGDANTGMWQAAADSISWSTGGVERLRLDSSGRLGIGATTPGELLDIVGDGVGTNIRLTRYGANPGAIWRAAGGSLASPSHVLANGLLGGFVAAGYHSGGAFGGNTVGMFFKAAENFASTALGTMVTLEAAAIGATSRSIAIQAGPGATARFPGVGTTASAANAYLDSGDGNNLLRSTSSLAYKRDVEPLDINRAKALLALDPIWYRSTAEADNPEWSWYGFAAEDVAAVDPRMVHFGYQADDYEAVEVVEPGAPAIAAVLDDKGNVLDPGRPGQGSTFRTELRLRSDAEKRPDGVAYERFVAHHHLLIQELYELIDELRSEIAQLRGS